MHKNMRRSIAIAATATGMWALGTAAANADELPVSVPLSSPDHAADVADAADVIGGVDGGSVTDKAEGVKHAAQGLKDTAQGLDGGTAQSKEVAHLTGHAPEIKDRVAGTVEETAGATTDRVTGSQVGTPAPEAPVDYLFGPIEQLPGYGQNAGRDHLQEYAHLQDYAQTATPGALNTARTTAGGALTQTAPVVGQTSDAVLPPVAADAVSGVLPVVGQALGDVSTLVRGVVGDVTPFADGVVAQAAVPFVQGVTTEVQPLAYGVTGAVQPFAEGVVSEVQPLAQGLTGDAVAPFAQGVTTRVMPLAQGVGTQVRPLAGGLVGTVGDDARPAAANAAYGAQGLTSVTPDYVSDAVAPVTSLSPAHSRTTRANPIQGI